MDPFWDGVGHGGPPHNPTGVIRVMVVDDHPLLRQSMTTALLAVPGFAVVGQAASGEEAIDLFRQVRPDIILMDLIMPGMGSVAAIRAIRQIDSQAKILVVGSFDEADWVREVVREALQAGAMDYQRKAVGEIGELVTAIRQAVHGFPQ